MIKRLTARVRAEEGFGLIELAMAMVMLNIGILAIVAAFNSGGLALRRASLVANATTLADTYLERYRGFRNCQIYLDATAPGGIPTTGTYATDPAYNASQITKTSAASGQIPATCKFDTNTTAWPWGLTASQQRAVTAHSATVPGADLRNYVVDVYITPISVTTGGNQKQVTVVVRDPLNPTGSLVRESSTFDPFDAP